MNAPLRSAEAIAAAAAWKPSHLTRMLLLCQREADRIEIWQSGREGAGVLVPAERWDIRQRHERDLFLRLAQLVHIVSLIEPDFRRLVTTRLGASMKKAKAEAATEEAKSDDAGADTIAAE